MRRHLRCPLSGEKSILYVSTYKVRTKYVTTIISASTPVHLKSLKLLIPPLPSPDLLSQKVKSWKCVCLLVHFIDARIMGRLSKRASITKNASSSKKAKEDAVDTVHYLEGVDEDDENEEGIDDEGSGELEEAIEQLVINSNRNLRKKNNEKKEKRGENVWSEKNYRNERYSGYI